MKYTHEQKMTILFQKVTEVLIEKSMVRVKATPLKPRMKGDE